MGSLFHRPNRPPKPKGEVDQEAAEAGERERELQRRKRGRASTIVTGPQGDLAPTSAAVLELTGTS